MRIELPFPLKILGPNVANRLPWAAKVSAKNKQKNEAYLMTKSLKNTLGKSDEFALVVTYISPNRKTHDLDNLLASSKSQIDGIALALGINDRKFNPITIKREIKKGTYGVVFEIFEVSASN